MNTATTPSAGSLTLGALTPLWVWTLIASYLGAWLCFLHGPGLNWLLFTLTACVGFMMAARQSDLRLPGRQVTTALILAIAVSGAAAVTRDPVAVVLVFLSVTALCLYALLASVKKPDELEMRLLLLAWPWLASRVLFSTRDRSIEMTSVLRTPASVPIMRGTLMAVGLTVPLFLLLSTANPALGEWRDALADSLYTGEWPARAVAMFMLGFVLLGAYGLVARRTQEEDPAEAAAGVPPVQAGPPSPWHVSAVERMMVLGGATLVFIVFFAAEFSNRYGLLVPHLEKGVTLADATHRGFGQMILAAGLCAAVLITLEKHALRGEGEGRVRLLAWAMILGSILTVASAAERVFYYEDAYGFTRLRLYVQVCCVAVALALLLLAWEVRAVIQPPRLIRRVAVTAIVCAAGLAYWNSTAWIIDTNVDRFTRSGQLDSMYLAELASGSPDGIPALIARMPQVPAAIAGQWRAALSCLNLPRLAAGTR